MGPLTALEEARSGEFQPPPSGRFITLFGEEHITAGTPKNYYMKLIPISVSKSIWNVLDVEANIAYIIETSGNFKIESVIRDGKGNEIARMSKNPIFLGKWAVKDPTGRIVLQTKCIPGLAKYGILGCVPDRSSPASLAAVPAFDLSMIELSQMQKPNKITPENRFPFCAVQYGPDTMLAVQTLFRDSSFILRVAPGGDVVLALCMLCTYLDLSEWNTMRAFF